MRVVLDTNVLVSALLVETTAPAKLLWLWRKGKITVVSATQQLDELTSVLRYPKIRERLRAGLAGRLVNELREIAEMVEPARLFDVSPDSCDDYLLGICAASSADNLITGDKSHLLALKKFRGTKIVSVRQFFTTTGFLREYP